MSDKIYKGHIIFDHDGTLVDTENRSFLLFLGVANLLRFLVNEDFKLSIWTARPRRSTLEIINHLEIASYFSQIYCSDDGPPKPDPAGLAQLTKGFSKEQCLHIGDSPGDFQGAHDFGIQVVAACWNNVFTVEKYSKLADYTALNLEDCKKIIKGKFNV